jgi:hypothetical protein
MKTTNKILTVVGLCIALGFASCNKDEKDPSTLSLDKTTVAGNVGDNFTVTVTTAGDEITTVKVTKFLDGTADAGFTTVTGTITNATYEYSGTIVEGDEDGALVYTFTGYNGAGTQVDAADLTITVTLTGVPLLTKYDWRKVDEIWGEQYGSVIESSQYLLDDVNRFNKNYSWEFDWGDVLSAGELETINQYCAWKTTGTTSNVETLSLIKFGFLATDPTITEYTVDKLDAENLWISYNNYDFGEEVRITEKFVAVSKSPTFTPYRGKTASDYTWATCTPGSY